MKSDYQILFGGYTNTFFNSKGGSPRKKKKKIGKEKVRNKKTSPQFAAPACRQFYLQPT